MVQHVCVTEPTHVHVRMQPVHVEEHKDQLQLHLRLPLLHLPQIQRRLSTLHLFDDFRCRSYGPPPRLALHRLLSSSRRLDSRHSLAGNISTTTTKNNTSIHIYICNNWIKHHNVTFFCSVLSCFWYARSTSSIGLRGSASFASFAT